MKTRSTSDPIKSRLLRAIFGFGLWFTCSTALAQGWINFMNSPGTLITISDSTGIQPVAQGTYYFSLLTAPPGIMDPAQFSFGGLYATNQTTPGRFFGGTFVQAPNWPVGANKSFIIAGWSANLGANWNQAWLHGIFSNSGYFGLSSVGTGIAGGIFDTNRPPLPPLVPFGGKTGIQTGFSLFPVDVPEPSIGAMILVGTALFGVFYRKSEPRL